jgi:HSP20 family molecular chaperone IbpA
MMRNIFNNPWLDQPFDTMMMMYDPFRVIDNRMSRRRVHRNGPYYSSPTSLISRWADLDENLNQLTTPSNNDSWPQVSDDGKSVSLKFKLPNHVDPNKVNVTTKDGDVIVKVEEKIEKDNATTEYSYYQRSTLPRNTNFESMKAFVNDKDKEVSIEATLKEEEKLVSAPRQIPIQSEKQQQITI